jgi:hypothetical protein
VKDEAILYVETNKQGSRCETGLGISKAEYAALTEEEKQQLINEFLSNVMDTWVD